MIPIAPSFHGGFYRDIVIHITASTNNYNILTAAQAEGYDNTVGNGNIIIYVDTGVVVNGTSSYAMRTGAVHQNTNVTINVASGAYIYGYFGADFGGTGGDAVYWETSTGGNAIYTINNEGIIGGGGGGRGNRGGRQDYVDVGKGNFQCVAPTLYGSYGSVGSYGNAGTAGSYGGGSNNCIIQVPTSGGAAGYSVRKNSRTVTTGGGGTYAGSAA
jgi:hypothetical protein